MYKIAHISDTHIRNLKYHKEYKQVFQQMYDMLKEQKPDYIIHCGDIAHTKTQISPEFVDMASDMFRSLANIAPTFVILGNHDGNLRNSTRQDALSPIIDALNLPNLKLLKKSGELHVDDTLCFNVLSIFDEEGWEKISNPNKINIALYHGTVSGVETDQGYVLEHGDHPVEIFQGFDFAMLGDIHKTNQVLDMEGRIRYPGSTVQQNHGETNDKGYLLWEIHGKDKFKVSHHSIKNPLPFITVELETDGSVPENLLIPENARLRLVSNTHISPQALKKSVDVAKKRFKPDTITVHNRPGKRISVEEISNTIEEDNLRDLKIQESLIREYLTEYKLSPRIERKILDLNKKYNLAAEQTEEVARNVNWKLKKIEWSNLFNFGESNSIDFEKINGIIGIFGKNYTGKSSTIDTILWSMFNSISKKVRKNVDIINQNKEIGSAKVELEIDNKIYTVQRQSTKYLKKLYGEETTEAKTIVDFSVLDTATDLVDNLNGDDRNATDANVRKVFGTIDDFLITSMSSQESSMSFINEGSTRRKEILGKFLDLEMFEKKFKLAKDDSALLKGAIKRLDGKDFDKEIETAELRKTQSNILYKEGLEKAAKETLDIRELRDSLSKIEGRIEIGPKQEFIDIEQVEKELDNTQKSIKICVGNEIEYAKQIKDQQNYLNDLNSKLSQFNVDDLKKDKLKFESLDKELNGFLSNKKWSTKELQSKKERIAVLDAVPCEDKFPNCKFLVEANKDKLLIPDLNLQITKNDEEISSTKLKLEELKVSLLSLDLAQQTKDQLSALQSKLADLELKKEKNKNMFKNFETQKSVLEAKRNLYFENEEWMKELSKLKNEKVQLVKKIQELELEKEITDKQVLDNFGIAAQSDKEIAMLENQKKELSDLRDEYLAYDLFLKCMHNNGIVYDIIKKKLPVINQEIAKNLTNIVNFEIFFEDDGKKLDIFIRHPKYESRPIELCSGAEKTLASMAIRLALIKVTSLPVGDVFILDEPATALDEENMEGFSRILEMIKSQFKTVIIISHLDALKDVVDDQIVIDNIDGYARINM